MKPKATLKKLSDVLGLSISTVSRALKDHPDISEDTKKKVRELADVLEYEPNTYAINLRTNNSKVFAVVVPAISNLFYQSFISAVEEEARRTGYMLLILQSGENPQTELDNLRFCRQNRVTGIFVSITTKTTDIRPFLKMDELDVPIIFFDKVPDFEACNKVCVADKASATIAASALLSRNRKKILGLFGNPEMSITRKRLPAFKETLSQSKTKLKLFTDYAMSPEEARRQVHKYCRKAGDIDGIFCMSDEILTGVMKAVQELKLNVPNDVSIIAISDGFIPQLYEPEISYVETSGYKLGKMAFARMLACLSGSTFVQELTAESLLIDGGSL